MVKEALSATAPFTSALTGWIEAITQRMARYRLYRTTLNEMEQLSDRDLADLGLSRSMLSRIAWQAACEA